VFHRDEHMKISGPINRNGVVPPAGRSGTGGSSTIAQGASGDRIQLSGLGAALSQGASSLHGIKLSGLGSAVSGGRYRPDAGAVSSSIIQHSLVAA
jgi:hypothetical protein